MTQEFYFVRHGQTDHNASEGHSKIDHPYHIGLNQAGKIQAAQIEPIIAKLPIQAICASPLKRAQETMDIIASHLTAPHYDIYDLGECTASIWNEMVRNGMHTPLPPEGEARIFIEKVRNGINYVLSLPSPALIVAHGGVHWALCCLMGIQNHPWTIGNCSIVHFAINDQGKWIAKTL